MANKAQINELERTVNLLRLQNQALRDELDCAVMPEDMPEQAEQWRQAYLDVCAERDRLIQALMHIHMLATSAMLTFGVGEDGGWG